MIQVISDTVIDIKDSSRKDISNGTNDSSRKGKVTRMETIPNRKLSQNLNSTKLFYHIPTQMLDSATKRHILAFYGGNIL